MESQVQYAISCIQKLQKLGKQSMEVRTEAEEAYTQMIHREMKRTIWQYGGCKSWYQNEDGKITALFPGFTFTFRKMARQF